MERRDKVEPALTSEEWEMHLSGRHPITIAEANDRYSEHAAAAVALHGQPFGFTREDVSMLRERAAEIESDAEDSDRTDTHYDMVPVLGEELRQRAERYTSLADRIEALLPPVSAD